MSGKKISAMIELAAEPAAGDYFAIVDISEPAAADQNKRILWSTIEELVVRIDGTNALSADWDIGDGIMIQADKIRARDGDGLSLFEDGGAGIFIEDGGQVGIGTVTPGNLFHVASEVASKGGRFGNAFVGNWTTGGANGNAIFANKDVFNSQDKYSVLHSRWGASQFNSASGQDTIFTIAGVPGGKIFANLDWQFYGTTNDFLLFIDYSADKVGINTNTPSAMFDVAGTIAGTTQTLSGDNASVDTAYVPMILYNTDAAPPAASGFPIGTLYVQYTE